MSEQNDSELRDPSPVPPSPVPSTKKKPWVLLTFLVFLLIGIVDVGAFLAEPPKTRVFEANICLT